MLNKSYKVSEYFNTVHLGPYGVIALIRLNSGLA